MYRDSLLVQKYLLTGTKVLEKLGDTSPAIRAFAAHTHTSHKSWARRYETSRLANGCRASVIVEHQRRLRALHTPAYVSICDHT